MRRLLLIDGNYFGNRVLGQINMGDSVNNLNTEIEQKNFFQALNNSLINLYKTFNNESSNLIDQIIFVSDYGSWRKDIKPYVPYYLKDDKETPLGYKEQRKAIKDESPINYDNFYKIYNEFIENIKDKVIVFKINKLEGDDELMLLVNKLSKISNTFNIIFCTDSDLNQTVRDNVVLMRNIRSKEAPNGEFVLTENLYKKIFEQSTMDALLGGAFDNSYFKNLFSIQIGSIDGRNKIERILDKGISIATPFKTALVKSVAGDKKDNIFSLLSWKAKTGSRNYHITEKYIEKALKIHGYNLSEENCQKILSSKETLFNLLLALREVTKQKDVELTDMAYHLKHNLKINMLSVKNLPEELRIEFNNIWEQNLDKILNEKINENNLMKLYKEINYNPKNKGKDIFNESIPEIVESFD